MTKTSEGHSSLNNGNVFVLFVPEDIEEKNVICYYTSWSIYRTNQYVFRPSQIDPFLCTHIIYAFGAFDRNDQVKPFDEYQDVNKGEDIILISENIILNSMYDK